MKKITLYILIFIIGAFFWACNSQEDNNDDDHLSQATVVRIMASIDLGEDSTPTRSMTRASESGTVEEGNADYNEDKEPGNDNENKVSIARLFAFDPLSGSIVKNILYRLPGEALGSGEMHFAYDYNQSAGKMSLNLDMQIMSGNYLFVLITNEEAAWNLGAVTNHSALINSASNFLNPIVKVTDLDAKVADKSGIPMIGQAAIRVAPNTNATAENPQIINDPVIKLERTIAKVEVSIRNTEDGVNVIETAKPYQIKSVTLIYGNQKYNLFKESSTSVTEQYSNYVSTVTHTAGGLFTKQNIFTGYIAERKGITEDKATKVRIVATANGTDYEYDIPLFQYEADGKTKNYDIRRNTIYRLGTKLVGKELGFELDVYTEVAGWTKEEIVNVTDNDQHILYVDRRTIYVDPTMTDTYHTETICFKTDLEYISNIPSVGGINVSEASPERGEYTHAFKISIPRRSVSGGVNQSIKFNFGRGEEIVASITIMVKSK